MRPRNRTWYLEVVPRFVPSLTSVEVTVAMLEPPAFANAALGSIELFFVPNQSECFQCRCAVSILGTGTTAVISPCYVV